MMLKLTALLVTLSSLTLAAKRVDTGSFFVRIQGTYQILQAGGIPGALTDQGTIQREPGMTYFAMKYCPPNGGCDPGYYDFEDAKTTVTELPAVNASLYQIDSVIEGNEVKFTWEEKGGLFYFRNHQYRMPEGNIVTLEHELKKLP